MRDPVPHPVTMTAPMESRWASVELRRSLLNPDTRRRVVLFTLFSAGAAVLSIVALDQPVAHAVESLPRFVTQPAQRLSDLMTLGHAWPVLVLAIGVCLWAGLRDAARWMLFAILAALASGAVVNVLKFLVGRQRPTVLPFEAHHLQPFTLHYPLHSFPSGHSADAAVWATVLALANPKTRRWAIPLAIMFASTRVLINAHWLSDVIVGLTAGCLTTLALHALFVRRQHAAGMIDARG